MKMTSPSFQTTEQFNQGHYDCIFLFYCFLVQMDLLIGIFNQNNKGIQPYTCISIYVEKYVDILFFRYLITSQNAQKVNILYADSLSFVFQIALVLKRRPCSPNMTGATYCGPSSWPHAIPIRCGLIWAWAWPKSKVQAHVKNTVQVCI